MSDGRPHPLVELTRMRVREFLREPEALFWVFAFPVLMACALGVAFRSQEPQPIPIGIQAGQGADVLVRTHWPATRSWLSAKSEPRASTGC